MRFSKSVTNMALKHVPPLRIIYADFGTIRNNTALKPRGPIFVTTFRNRAIHLS